MFKEVFSLHVMGQHMKLFHFHLVEGALPYDCVHTASDAAETSP
jgi:hypothetical protein